jgi:serine/threonine-protein kinase HipA
MDVMKKTKSVSKAPMPVTRAMPGGGAVSLPRSWLVPAWRLETVAGKPVLLLRRFDRQRGMCVPFLSAMSMLDAKNQETRSYLEFVDVLRQHGASPREDMRALWRRIVFSILISNTDDHLRNHGFLYADPAGWRLAPAYDLNPVPTDIKPRILTTAIDLSDGTASLKLALEVAAYFELGRDEARKIAAEVGRATATWRRQAKKLGLTAAEIDRMASSFEHQDLKEALAGPRSATTTSGTKSKLDRWPAR